MSSARHATLTGKPLAAIAMAANCLWGTHHRQQFIGALGHRELSLQLGNPLRAPLPTRHDSLLVRPVSALVD
jgi:hypothetical protein